MGGGDTVADFEYVDEERQSTNFDAEFSISFDPAEFAMLYPSLINYPAAVKQPVIRQGLQPDDTKPAMLNNLQPAMNTILLPDNNEYHDNFRKVPSIIGNDTSAGPNRPPKCIWGIFGKMMNPTNPIGNCNLECSYDDIKVQYRVKRWFFRGPLICCCTPKR